MATVGSVTRQIAALEISNKKVAPSSSSSSTVRTLHTKQSSQTNVSKLLTKYAAPNPFLNAPNKPTHPSSLRHPTQTSSKQPEAVQSSLDIGRYDGGLEIDNEKRGAEVFGEAAEELALDSSISRQVASFLALKYEDSFYVTI
jgi:aurora kinase